jgi:hypothetical protein
MPPPVLTAPPGGDVNRGPALLAILWVTAGLALFFVLSRLYVRLAIIKWHGMDDYLIITSMVRSLRPFDFPREWASFSLTAN